MRRMKVNFSELLKASVRRLRSGSSLILVTIVIAAIVVVVFGANRLTLVQYSQTNRDEDKILARYAAKASIEDGLARFRFNRDAQTQKDKVFKFDLTAGQALTANEVPESQTLRQAWGINFDPSHQYYDLKINFKTDMLGDVDVANSTRTLNKDDTLQLSGFAPDAPGYPSGYYLAFVFQFIDGGSGCEGAFVQLQEWGELVSGNTNTFDQFTANKPAGASYDKFLSWNSSQNLFIRGSQQNSQFLTTTVRVRSYKCAVKYGFRAVGTNSVNGPAVTQIDSLESDIIGTGYFGDAKQTLVAKVDRNTGRLISIYDFNLYAGGGNIKKP